MLAALGLLGAVFGSLYNVLIYRLPRENFWQRARSYCPHCETSIPFYLNIPIISFIILRGRSACCNQKIAWHYPIVEFISAALAIALYLKFPFLDALTADINNTDQLWRYVHAYLFCSLLLVASVIDLYHMIIPDEISLGMVALTPLFVFLHPELGWLSAAIGVIVGGALLFIISWGYWFLRRKIGMGMGDVKLLAGIGGWLGYEGVFPVLLYASVLGTVVALLLALYKRTLNLQSALPFGPFLALGAVIHLWLGNRFLTLLIG